MHSNFLYPNRREIIQWFLALATHSALAAEKKKDFLLFDALLHRGKPNLSRLGITACPPIANIWRKGANRDLIDELGLKIELNNLRQDTPYFFIDIENWPILRVSREERKASISKLIRVAEIAREKLPNSKFGFYGIPPGITYWPLVDHRPTEYSDWISANEDMMALAEKVDVIMPSLYTFYKDEKGWLTYAKATIDACKKFNKPIYPFLWFEYHDSNFLLRNHEIDTDYWNMQLQFCYDNCNGLILWGGSQRNWSESAAWWKAVMSKFGLKSPIST